MAASVFEGGSPHPTMHCWRGLPYSTDGQMEGNAAQKEGNTETNSLQVG